MEFYQRSFEGSSIRFGHLALVDSYLCNRKVLFMDRNRIIRVRVDKGCPQGSFLGLLFWKLVADNILKSMSPPGTFIAYDDDFLLLEAANSRRQLESKVNCAL